MLVKSSTDKVLVCNHCTMIPPSASRFFTSRKNSSVNRLETPAIHGLDGSEIRRLESRVFNLEQEQEFEEFAKKGSKEIILPESNRKVYYQQEKKIGIGLSTLGTNKAVMLGAYYYAVNKL